PWVFALIAAGIAVAKPRISSDSPDARRWVGALGVLAAAGLASVSLGGVYLRHYWRMLDPVLAVAAAAGVVALLRAPRPWIVAAAAVVGALWVPSQWTDKRRLARSFLFDRTAAPPTSTPSPTRSDVTPRPTSSSSSGGRTPRSASSRSGRRRAVTPRVSSSR